MIKRVFSRREIVIMAVAGSFLAALFIVKGLYIPFRERREDLHDRIARNETLLNKNLRIVRKSKIYEQRYARLLEAFKQKGADEQAMSAMLSEIEEAAKGMQIHMSDMKPQKVRKADVLNTFSVSLIFDGPLVSVLNFVHVLQTSPHLFQIDELRLEKKSYNSTDLKCYLILNRLLIQP